MLYYLYMLEQIRYATNQSINQSVNQSINPLSIDKLKCNRQEPPPTDKLHVMSPTCCMLFLSPLIAKQRRCF
jgi:hypothetical protein